MKNFIQKLLIAVAVTTSLYSSTLIAADFHIEFQPQVIEKVIQIEQKGILKQKANGYLYVEVSDDFIAETIPLIETSGIIVPPGHYTSKKGIGAHISVIYETELDNTVHKINELGQEIIFNVIELRTVRVNNGKLWLIAVDAPELETLRESYGLSPLLKNHNFHITLGTEVQAKTARKIVELL